MQHNRAKERLGLDLGLRRPRPGQRGSALALSLVSVMIIAGLGASLLQLQMSIDRKSDFAVDRRRAVYMAEAGIAEAAFAVANGRSGIIASEAAPAAFGNGVFWVESDDLPDDRVILRCTAQVGTAELVVQSMVLPSVNPVTSLGVFGSEGVTIGWGSTIDGYHSGRGDYASQVDPHAAVLSTGRDGLVGSDANVVLDDSFTPRDPGRATHVFGRIRPGSNGSLFSSGAPQLYGSVESYDAQPYLPEVTLPDPSEVIGARVPVLVDTVGVGVTLATHVQGAVDVEADVTLTIEGPKVLRCESLSLESGATLVLDDSLGPIHIYAEEGLNFEFGSFVQSIAPEATSRGTYLMVPGSVAATSRVVFHAGGTFHGLVYAPDDAVVVPDQLRLIGSVVARLVMISPGAHVTVDRRLSLGNDGFAALPRQLTWQLVPLGKTIARRLSVEPRLALALRGITPTPSSVASLETVVEIQYMDLAGQSATYSGNFASFDPTRAERIIGARWEDPRDLSMRSWTVPVGSESTNAVEALRSDLRELRALVHLARPAVDVAVLTDDESIEEAAALITTETVDAQPISVQRAFQRSENTAAAAPAPVATPLARATRASNAARDLAIDAQLQLDQANSEDADTLTPAARESLERLKEYVASAAGNAEMSQEQADAVASGPRSDREKRATNSETFCIEARDFHALAVAEYNTFAAAL